MPPSSSAPRWLGAPPVHEEGFAYANGEFFAQASNENRHRRATLVELQAHFTLGSERDYPAHWFEAQLIHYGLKATKTKAAARMRLFDAVKDGKLAVPGRIAALEEKLKKEWTKKDREARKGGGTSSDVTEEKTKGKGKGKATEKAAGVKRKVEVSIDLTTNAVTVSASEFSKQPAAKKAKTASTPKKASSKAASTKSAKTEAASSTKTAATPKKSASKDASGTKTESAAPKKQFARCRRGGVSQGPSRGVSAATRSSPEPRYRITPTARRSNAFMARGRIPAPAMQDNQYDSEDLDDDNDYDEDDEDEAPPPYSEYQDDDGGSWGEDVSLAPLGLLNGRYDISCPYVTSEWPDLGSDFDLVLTLAGSSLWGSFDLGLIQGVMYFDERPWQSSHEKVWFKWRGREDEGPIIFGNRNQGWIKFLGDGRVEGWFDYQRIEFRGQRLSGQGTRSGCDARSLQNEWNGYSEEEYERENQARWG